MPKDRAIRIIVEEVGGDRRRFGYMLPDRIAAKEWTIFEDRLEGAITAIRDNQLLPPFGGDEGDGNAKGKKPSGK